VAGPGEFRVKTTRKIERLDITTQVEKAARAVGRDAGALGTDS
jgi:thiamine phosphate synthase YjbQ (UPF0047 family)